MPTSKLGKWSVGLNLAFLLVIAVSVVLATVFRVLHFGDRWWDVTVGVMVPVVLIAFITGIMARSKHHDRSGLVSLSIVTGIAALLFAALHSLFIKD